MLKIRKILVPIDFSKISLGVLDSAIDLAKKFKASLIVLHVVEELPLTQHPTVSIDSVQELLKDLEKQARDKLRKTVVPKIRKRVPATFAVARGAPFVEIIRTAKKRRADLIVIATHGRTGLSHMIMGSTAEKVVRKSACPVLTIRPARLRFRMP